MVNERHQFFELLLHKLPLLLIWSMSWTRTRCYSNQLGDPGLFSDNRTTTAFYRKTTFNRKIITLFWNGFLKVESDCSKES